MKSYSITVTKWLSLVVLVGSLILMGVGIWMSYAPNSACVKFLQVPVIVIGVCLLIVAVCGYVGAAYGIAWLLWIYAALLFVAMCLLFSFMVFSFVVTSTHGGSYNLGRWFKEYNLGDYSTWLRRYVNKRWDSIRPCVQGNRQCYLPGGIPDMTYELQLNVGCCKPPEVCGYMLKNETIVIPVPPSNASRDCARFVNDFQHLCFSCDSCKAAVLTFVKEDWRTGAQVMLVVFIIIFLAYFAGCCAVRQAEVYRCGYQRRIDI